MIETFVIEFNNYGRGTVIMYYVGTVRIVFPVCVFWIYHGAIFFLSLYCSVNPLRSLVTVCIYAFFILNNSLTLSYIVIYLDLFSSFLQDPTVNLHHYDI